MAATPETRAKKQIIDALKGACATMQYTLDLESHAGDSFSTPTVDITGAIDHPLNVHWAVPFAIEVKRFDGKGKLTTRQRHTLNAKAQAGIAAFLIDSPGTLLEFITWIYSGCPRRHFSIKDTF